jgi:starvation-inducible outer membrane lipoprotein
MKYAVLLLALLLAACGAAPDDLGPGGVSNSDAQALDEAAAKLDRVDSDKYREEIDPPPVPLSED